MIATAMAAIPAPAPSIPEMPWYRAFRRSCDLARKWISNTRNLLEYLLTEMHRGQLEIKRADWEIAEALKCSVRWVQRGLQKLEEWGIIRRYWRHGRAREAGRMIVLLVVPAGWFGEPKAPAKAAARPRAAASPGGTGRTPSRPYSPEELAKAAPPSKEDEEKAEAEARQRQSRAKGIWDSLTERQRREIEAQVVKENPGLDKRWGSVLEGMCVVRAEAEYGPASATPEDPRAP